MGDGKLARAILALQPVFAVPVFVSALAGAPPLWVAGIIAFVPLAVRFWLTRRFLPRTPFDAPIILLAVGLVVGTAVAADQDVATGALATTLASAIIYYGMVGNGRLADRYWVLAGGVVGAIALVLVLLFFSEAPHRVVPYNAWVFPLFHFLPKTGWPVLGFNSIGVLLSVLLPPLCAIALFKGGGGLRVGAAVLAGIFLLALVLTASGGGLIATACGLAFVLVCWRRWMAFVVAPALGAGAAVVALLYTRASWFAEVFSVSSFLSRVTLWEDTLRRLSGWGIVTGLGLGSWPDTQAWEFGWAPEHPHNSYLQVYSDTGILGGLAIVVAAVVFVVLARKALLASANRRWSALAVGLVGAAVAGAIFALYDNTLMTAVAGSHFLYVSVPLLWFWAATLVVAHARLTGGAGPAP